MADVSSSQPSAPNRVHVQLAREFVEGTGNGDNGRNGKPFNLSQLREHLHKNGVKVDEDEARRILAQVEGIDRSKTKRDEFREKPEHYSARMQSQLANDDPLPPEQVSGPVLVKRPASATPTSGVPGSTAAFYPQRESLIPDADAGEGHNAHGRDSKGKRVGGKDNPYAALGEQQAEQQQEEAAQKLGASSAAGKDDHYKYWLMKTLGLSKGVHDHHVLANGGENGHMHVQTLRGGHFTANSSGVRFSPGLGKKMTSEDFYAVTVESARRFGGKVSVKGEHKHYQMHAIAHAIAYNRAHPGGLHLKSRSMKSFSKRERALILKEASELSYGSMSSLKDYKLVQLQNETAILENEAARAARDERMQRSSVGGATAGRGRAAAPQPT